MKRTILSLILLAAIIIAASVMGCTAPEQKTKDTLYGKEIFDPAKFSMAQYAIGESASTGAIALMTVLSSPHEAGGDRLSSIEISGNKSTRLDVWLDKKHDRINDIQVTAITGRSMQKAHPTLTYNMTVLDRSWNSLESQYVFNGYDNVTTPAGTFENCSVYYGIKSIDSGGQVTNLSVYYYMHQSSPVPVMYVIESPNDSIIYLLTGVYGPNDIDSSPERTAQSYFDRLGTGDYLQASRLLVTYDSSGIHGLDRQSVLQLSDNMGQTYGKTGNKTTIQYVYVDSVTKPIEQTPGYDTVLAHWTSVQYDTNEGLVYSIDGNFKMINDKGKWRIVV